MGAASPAPFIPPELELIPSFPAGAHPEFSSRPSLRKAPVPPESDPRQLLAMVSQHPPAGSSSRHYSIPKSTSRWIIWEHHRCASASRAKFLSPRLSKHPELPRLPRNPRDTLDWSPVGAPAPSSSLIPLEPPSLCHRGQIQQDLSLLALQRSQKLGSLPRHFPKLWVLGSALPLAGAEEGTGKPSCDNSISALVTLGTSPASHTHSREFRAGSGFTTRRSGTQTRFVGRKNLGWLRCLHSSSIMKMLKRRVT